jgi:hypothetical protein
MVSVNTFASAGGDDVEMIGRAIRHQYHHGELPRQLSQTRRLRLTADRGSPRTMTISK